MLQLHAIKPYIYCFQPFFDILIINLRTVKQDDQREGIQYYHRTAPHGGSGPWITRGEYIYQLLALYHKGKVSYHSSSTWSILNKITLKRFVFPQSKVGAVNFNVLHSLLHVIIQQMNLTKTQVEFRGPDCDRIRVSSRANPLYQI